MLALVPTLDLALALHPLLPPRRPLPTQGYQPDTHLRPE